MKRLIVSLAVLGSVALLSCSDSRIGSTEVENEFNVVGYAAEGYALESTQIELSSLKKEKLNYVDSDSLGFYSLNGTSKEKILVLQEESRGFMTLVFPQQNQDTIRAHLNVLSTFIAAWWLNDKKVWDGTSELSFVDLKITPSEYKLVADSLMQIILESDLSYEFVGSDKDFRPARRNGGVDPSLLDGILHSIYRKSAEAGMSELEWIAKHFAEHKPLLKDTLFLKELERNKYTLGGKEERWKEEWQKWAPHTEFENGPIEEILTSYREFIEKQPLNPPQIDGMMLGMRMGLERFFEVRNPSAQAFDTISNELHQYLWEAIKEIPMSEDEPFLLKDFAHLYGQLAGQGLMFARFGRSPEVLKTIRSVVQNQILKAAGSTSFQELLKGGNENIRKLAQIDIQALNSNIKTQLASLAELNPEDWTDEPLANFPLKPLFEK